MILMHTHGTSVDIGDVILDVGCRLTQDLRAHDKAPPATRCTVTKVYSWGVRVTNGQDEWDCEHWILPEEEDE